MKKREDHKNEDIDMKAVIATLEKKRQQFNNGIDSAISSLKMITGLNVGIPASGSSEQSGNGGTKITEIRSDTFFKKTFIEAVIMYLEMGNRQPQKTEDILRAVKKGGLDISEPSAGTMLRSRAGKDKDIVRIKRGEWGLKEWYGK